MNEADAGDILIIDDETVEQDAAASAGAWRVLIVDDDADVHRATTLAMKGIEIFNRPVVLLHAHGARETIELLTREENIAVAFIDVVMESRDSGLKLIEHIRDEGMAEIRLVLRTGQPGLAPERSVIAKYDINDYRTKSELTRDRLISVLTSAIRSYCQIREINQSRAGLEMIVNASTDLSNRRNLGLFSRGVLTQVAAVMGVPASGLVCVASVPDDEVPAPEDFVVVSDAGRFADMTGRRLPDVGSPQLTAAYAMAAATTGPAMVDGNVAMLFRCAKGRQLFAYLDSAGRASEANFSLLKVFAANIAVSFENIDLVERLDRLAFVDAVIGCPNVNAFTSALGKLLPVADNTIRVVKIALNEIGSIKGTFGLQMADLALKAAYDLLARTVPSAQLVARVSDQGFAIIVDRNEVDLDALRDAFAEPVAVSGVTLSLPATLAVVDVTPEMDNAQEILRDASAAMLIARRDQRRDVVHYHPSIGENVRERARLQSALQAALNGGNSITANLQPKVDLNSGRIIGAEALARWSLDGQPIGPNDFIPIAEASGLSRAITRSIIRDVGAWTQARRHPPIPVAINLSMFDINEDDFIDDLLAAVAAAGLGPDTVQFEVTESGMMHDPDRAIELLGRLRQSGFQIGLDDFGTGYASLSHLKRLPVDILKIDREFVDALSIATARESIAAMTVALGQSFNLAVVAEGVETIDQHQALRFLGCGIGQGYLYGRPVPIDQFDATFGDWSLDETLGRAAGSAD